jgi:hypothetical protein
METPEISPVGRAFAAKGSDRGTGGNACPACGARDVKLYQRGVCYECHTASFRPFRELLEEARSGGKEG